MFKIILKIVLLFATLVAAKKNCARWLTDIEGQIQLIPLTQRELVGFLLCNHSYVEPQIREKCEEIMEFLEKYVKISYDVMQCDPVRCYQLPNNVISCPQLRWPFNNTFVVIILSLASGNTIVMLLWYIMNYFPVLNGEEDDDISTSSSDSDASTSSSESDTPEQSQSIIEHDKEVMAADPQQQLLILPPNYAR